MQIHHPVFLFTGKLRLKRTTKVAMGSLHLQCWCWDAEAKISAKTPVQSVLAGDYPPSLHAEPVEQLLSDLKFNTVHTKGQCKASRTGLRTI
jgi:hypothetical protein